MVGMLYEMVLRLEAIFSFLGHSRPEFALPLAGDTRYAPGLPKQGIALRIVRFKYPGGDVSALHHSDGVLPAGNVTALVGSNGAGKAALSISHRCATVQMADNTLVLESGVILESGSHEKLMAANGRYATLYAMQASRRH